MPHQAHHGLGGVELLSHQRLGNRRWSGAAPGARGVPGAAAVLVLVIRVGAGVGAVAASSIPAAAISVRGGGRGGRAVPVTATSTATVAAVVAAAATVLGAAPAYRTHSPIALVLVHQVGIVRVGGATETGTASSSASSTASVHQLQQFGIDGLSGLLQHPDQLPGLAEVPWSEEGVGRAFIGAACCAANAMDVVLRGVGIVVVDDKLDILHILTLEAAAGDDQSQGRKRQRGKRSQNKTNTG